MPKEKKSKEGEKLEPYKRCHFCEKSCKELNLEKPTGYLYCKVCDEDRCCQCVKLKLARELSKCEDCGETMCLSCLEDPPCSKCGQTDVEFHESYWEIYHHCYSCNPMICECCMRIGEGSSEEE